LEKEPFQPTCPMIDPALKNANILVVDDKQANIDILTGFLELQGYTNLRDTTDPRLVVSLLKSFNPDLILLDLMMPHLNGFEVMQQLKELIPLNTFLPILVLTADNAVETKQRALSGGAKDFLAKPFDLIEVGLRIENLLESRYLHQQLQNQNKILEEKVKERTLKLEIANQDLETANKELKVLDQAKVDFLQLISHEIRTPLNGIKGFSYILKSGIQSPELLEYLQFLDDSVVRLEKFSYQALMITELLSGKSLTQMEEVYFRELFDQTYYLLRDKIQSKNIDVQLNDPGVSLIPGNRKFLQTCFDCLVDNAVKYSSPGEVVIVKVYQDTVVGT
jgi:two-component system, sensor histidine kinase and response regulator